MGSSPHTVNIEEKEGVFPLSYKRSMRFVGLLSSTAKVPVVLKATWGTLTLKTDQGSFLEH